MPMVNHVRIMTRIQMNICLCCGRWNTYTILEYQRRPHFYALEWLFMITIHSKHSKANQSKRILSNDCIFFLILANLFVIQPLSKPTASNGVSTNSRYEASHAIESAHAWRTCSKRPLFTTKVAIFNANKLCMLPEKRICTEMHKPLHANTLNIIAISNSLTIQ